MLKKLVEDIFKPLIKIFTVRMDETTDISGNEQATVIIQFVDNEQSIQEHLIGFSDVSRTDSETLFKLLKDTLTSQGLSLLNIRGQCYDGASNISSEHQPRSPGKDQG